MTRSVSHISSGRSGAAFALRLFILLMVNAALCAPARADTPKQTGCAIATTDKPEDVIARCTAAIKGGLKKEELILALRTRSWSYTKMGNTDLALADVNHAVELNPNDGLSILLRAETYEAKKMYAEARADCERVIQMKGHLDGLAWQLLGDIDWRDKNRAKAIEDYTRAIEANPDNAAAYRRRGSVYEQDGKYSLSIADDNEVLRLDPDNTDAALNRSYDHLQRHEAGPAIDDANRVLRLKPDSVGALLNRGRGYLLENKFTEALADYTRVTDLEPKKPEAWIGRGNVFFYQGQYDFALAEYDHALLLAPDDPAAAMSKATIALSRGDAAQSISLADSVLQKKPEYSRAYRDRGFAEFMLQQWDKAAKDFSEAAKLAPERAYTALWQYLAVSRGGGDGKPELVRELTALTSVEWPMPVGLFYAGREKSSFVLNEATSAEAYRDKQLKCEAYFYLGEADLLAGDKAAATENFKKTLATGVLWFTEYQMANAELKRLNAGN